MRDLKLGDFPMTYQEVCAEAEKRGCRAERDPNSEAVKKLKGILRRCEPIASREADDDYMTLKGVFLYQSGAQTHESGLRSTFGFCEPLDVSETKAIIGIADELLEINSGTFQDFVYLHERIHCAEMNHSEEFQGRFNALLLTYCLENLVGTRFDVKSDWTNVRRNWRYKKRKGKDQRRGVNRWPFVFRLPEDQKDTRTR